MRKPSEKRKLTDRFVASADRVPSRGRRDWWDDQVPGFGLRVSASGARVFVFYCRWPSTGKPGRRLIGSAARMSLADARSRAKEWGEMVARGVDPGDEARRLATEEARRRANTFGSVVEDYIRENLADKRRGAKDAREIQRHVLPAWRGRPITSITTGDVMALVKGLRDRGKLATARLVLSHIKRIFSWAIHEGVERYGVENSPAFVVSPKKLIGKKRPRQRVLSDDELRALWRATGRMGYPVGDAVRLILLTGCRRREIAEASWRETDRARRLITIPPERFKSDETHLVPLSAEAMAIIQRLPRHRQGDHIFTTTLGARPINGWSQAKREIDARMMRTLRALARARGENPAEVRMERWVLHDLRHTVRTRMAAMRIPDNVAEMVIGHGKRGMQRIYDQHHYLDEMREALEAWAALLVGIADPQPAPDNVVSLARVRA